MSRARGCLNRCVTAFWARNDLAALLNDLKYRWLVIVSFFCFITNHLLLPTTSTALMRLIDRNHLNHSRIGRGILFLLTSLVFSNRGLLRRFIRAGKGDFRRFKQILLWIAGVHKSLRALAKTMTQKIMQLALQRIIRLSIVRVLCL